MAASLKKIQVGIVDDHSLLRKALAKLIDSFENYSVLFEGDNGKEIKAKIRWDILLKISAKTGQKGNNYQDEINTIPHATKVMEIVQLKKLAIKKARSGARASVFY